MADEQQNKEPQAKTVKGRKYTGQSDVREITKAQWAKAGAEGVKEDTVLSAENDFTIKESDLTKEALALLEKDPEFKQVDVPA